MYMLRQIREISRFMKSVEIFTIQYYLYNNFLNNTIKI